MSKVTSENFFDRAARLKKEFDRGILKNSDKIDI
jgi:hypothetical protein